MMLARRTLLIGCLLALFLVLALAVTGPVEALRRDGFTIKRGEPVSRDFPALAGNSGSGVSVCGCSPPVCDTVTYCDTVPVTVEVPALGPSDDFFVRITLMWDYQKVDGYSGNNLDMRVYDKGRSVILARAEGGGEPESVTLYRPTESPYHVIVMNATGPNTGYKLTGSMIVDDVTTPFEVGEDSGPPQDLSGEPEPAPQQGNTPLPAFEESSQPLALAPIEGDAAFEGLLEQSGQLGRLLTPPSNLLNVQEEDSRPPPPPSGLKVLFWAGFFPAILVGMGLFWIKTKGAGRLEVA